MPRFPAPPLPLCLGGNVFGWTADEPQSFAVLDAFVDAGGTLIDTADSYSAWVPTNNGGESEAIIGKWMAARGNRADVQVITKVSQHPMRTGLKPANIRAAIDDSLKRLQTDYIDLYFAHFDDESAPLTDTFGTFEELLVDGKIRAYGLSNYSPERLTEALKVAPRASALQPKYSLVERADFEAERRAIAEAHDLAVLPYYALASGFLTGKYRPGDIPDGPRSGGAAKYLERPNGPRILEALDAVAGETGAPVAAVAIAWLAAQPTVIAPIASARSTDQLETLLHSVELTDDQLARLTHASE